MEEFLTAIDTALDAVGGNPNKVLAGCSPEMAEQLGMDSRASQVAGRLYVKGVFIQRRAGPPTVRGTFLSAVQ